MKFNLFPELLDRPIRNFPNLLQSSWANWPRNFFEEGLFPADFSVKGAQMYEKDGQLHVEVPLPGLDPNEIEVTVNQGVLMVKGEAKEEKEDKKKKYYHSSKRSYSYSVTLPTHIDQKHEPEANYKDGILDISLKITGSSEPKKITVKTKNQKK